MIDRETMIRALKCISADPDYEGACNDCPYLESCKNEDEYYLPFCDEKHLAADALALLREEEPQETAKPDFWISVEERLPKDSVEVFVLLKIKDVLVPDMGALICGNWWSTMSYNMMVGDPSFWADIPHGPDGYKWYTDVEVSGDATD